MTGFYDLPRWLMPLVQRTFDWIYQHGDWAYDSISWVVSGGRWQDWVRSMALWPEAQEGAMVLELGVGPGHLQVYLAEQGFTPYGIDFSQAMLRRARRCLKRRGYASRLARAKAQALPFLTDTFSRVVATFPSDYIFDPQTQKEVWRVLAPGGRFDALLTAASGLLLVWERFWGDGDPNHQKVLLEERFQPLADLGARVLVKRYPLPRHAWGWVVTAYKPPYPEETL